MTRSYYKHAETGIVAYLNDSLASVFGDRLVRVDAPDAEGVDDTENTAEVTNPANTAANPDNPTDSSKGGN
jgi:hypothetical protein